MKSGVKREFPPAPSDRTAAEGFKFMRPDTWQQRMKEQLYGVTISDPLILIVIALVALRYEYH